MWLGACQVTAVPASHTLLERAVDVAFVRIRDGSRAQQGHK
jgi:hypothetical protein